MPEAHDESLTSDEAVAGIPSSAFTPEQQVRLQAWFQTKWHHGPCPVCMTNNYAPPDRAWEIRPFFGGGLVIGGSGGIIPMFPVTCTNCGYTVWVNAIIAGVILGGTADERPT